MVKYDKLVTGTNGETLAGSELKRQEYTSTKELGSKQVTRRGFMTAGLAAVIGASVGYGVNKGGHAVGDVIAEKTNLEREVRAAYDNCKNLAGALNRKVSGEVEEFRQRYGEGQLQVYEDLQIAREGELDDLVNVIENCDKIQHDYDFGTRVEEFRTRVDGMILRTEKGLEGMRQYESGWFEKIEDSVRSMVGHPTGEDGKKYRKGLKKKVDALYKIYDSRRDNLTVQGEVLEHINEYIERTPDVSDEEKALFSCLRDEAKRGGHDNVREFIKNYDEFDNESHVYIELKNALTQAEHIYEQIREDKEYLEKLHGFIAEEKDLEAKVKAQRERALAEDDSIIKKDVERITGYTSKVVSDLKRKGYDIETKEEVVSRGTFGLGLRKLVDVVSYVAGAGAALGTCYVRGKGSKAKINKAVAKEAVNRHNDNARAFNELAGEHERILAELSFSNERADISVAELAAHKLDDKGEKNKSDDFPAKEGHGNDVY